MDADGKAGGLRRTGDVIKAWVDSLCASLLLLFLLLLLLIILKVLDPEPDPDVDESLLVALLLGAHPILFYMMVTGNCVTPFSV